MALESILIKFFIILSILFFLPKAIHHLYRIPYAVTEVALGIILGILLPQFFFADDMLRVLSTLGIITLFVFSGMDVEMDFIFKNKKFFLVNSVFHVILIVLVGISMQHIFDLSLQVALLVSLALTTPSASYILSALTSSNDKHKNWITSKAISGELVAIFLMIILIRISEPLKLLAVLVVVFLLIMLLPHILRYLYKVLFSKLIGSEFSFIFVVAIISAYVTDFLGVHFLVGAFIAGIVARTFISDIVKDKQYAKISYNKGKQLIVGFEFFALVFAPFYFFTVGLSISKEMFSWQVLIAVIIIGAAVTVLRLTSMSLHRMISIKEKFFTAVGISIKVLPTLVFTFVIADILLKQYGISMFLFRIMMLYGVLTALISIGLLAVLKKRTGIENNK